MSTIFDVAKAAGVSTATVSRVLNGSGTVAPQTVKTVLDIVDKLSYTPNKQAQNLRKSTTGTVLVMLADITNPYYSNVFAGINVKAQEYGYNIYLSDIRRRNAEEILKNAIESKNADGAILLSSNYDDNWLGDYCNGFPIVECCEYVENIDIPHVSVDNYKAGYDATKYLIDLGYRNIGMISTENKFMSTREREHGYKDALKKNGINPSAGNVAYADINYSFSSGVNAAKKLLTAQNRPDALFCIGDSVALSAVTCAKELGLKVPEDVSIVGFDDVIYTKMIHPYITTIIQPCEKLGECAMDNLKDLIDGKKIEDRYVILPHGFIERESTKPCRNISDSITNRSK